MNDVLAIMSFHLRKNISFPATYIKIIQKAVSPAKKVGNVWTDGEKVTMILVSPRF